MCATSRSQHDLQSRHLLPCLEAGHVTCAGSVDTELVQGQAPEGPALILLELNLIIILSGTAASSGRNCLSCVGIQCPVLGEFFATVNISFICLWLCTSPESCHLNQRARFVSVVIAWTQSGLVRAASLRAIALIVAGHVYRSFRA